MLRSTDEMTPDLIELARTAEVYDLGHRYFVGMAHHPTHPPFLFGLIKQHGEFITDGISSAADSIALGTHVGTHIDALCHFSKDGKLFGGLEAAAVQSYSCGFRELSVETIAPIVRRGVLLDIAGLEGVDVLPEDFAVTPEHMERASRQAGIEIAEGDVVLLRTGWSHYYNDGPRYLNQLRSPGPELPGAQWLSSRRIFAAGSDTIFFEKAPANPLPVHVHLLAESGIHIIEILDLERLAADRVYEFLFVAAPLKIQGATGAPLRPVAIARHSR